MVDLAEKDTADIMQEDATPGPQNRRHYSFYFSMLMLAMIAIIVTWDVTALSLALPIIAEQLHGTTLQSFWASIAFILGIAVTQPIYASVSDVFGRKSALYVSIILFAIGSVVFALAKNMEILIVGRLIKGLGAGGLDVLQTMIFCDITTLKERPRWLGVMSTANSVGAVTGPFIGGAFAEQIGWRWLGWVNLILAGITGALTYFFLHLTPIQGDVRDKAKRLDWIGFLLFTAISTTVSIPLSWANTLYPWKSWQTLVPLLLGLSLLVPFWFLEKRASVPMIPYQIFDNVSITSGVLCGFVYGALLNPLLLYLPLFFQVAFLEAPIEAAKSTLPLCCLVVSVAVIVSIIIEWSRRYRIALWLGWTLTTIFLGLNYIVGAKSSRAHVYVFQALIGAGLGMAQVATTISVLASVSRADEDGLAAGMLVTMRFLGSLIGFAICSTLFSSSLEKKVSLLQNLPSQLEALQDASRAVELIPHLKEVDTSSDIMQIILEAYEYAFHTVWIALAAFSGLALLLSLPIKENALEKEEIGRQGFNVTGSN